MPSLQTSNPVFCDVEASSLWGYAVEVAAVWAQGQAILSMSHLILPDPLWDIESYWDDAAASLHKITLDDLRRHGLPCFNVARAMNNSLKDREVFTDSALDHVWVRQIFDAADLDPTFHLREMLAGTLIDKLAREIGMGEKELKNIRQKVEAEYPHSHRAEPDARQWAELWRAIIALTR